MMMLACNKNGTTSDPSNPNPNNFPAEQTVTASLKGRVVDENGVPIAGAAVTSGGVSATTDINGIFSFANISLSSRFGFVKAVKQGYFTGSRSVITNAGASNYVTIELTPRTETGNFAASSGGSITIQGGATASFAASSFVTASTGQAYTGMVHIFSTYLDPTDPNLFKYMPGDLRGIGSDGNETALQSFGMLGVEMEDDNGNKLQLAAGQNATLTWNIPASLQAAAPASIAMWYFNDTTGRWIQQGTAVKQGDIYSGQVSHFTFWNCDAPMGTVNFKVHLIDQFGNPMAYRYIQFTVPGYGSRGGYTDSSGFAQGPIPKGEHLVMEVMSDCGGMIGGANVGPAVADVDLGIITVNIVHGELTLTGTVADCNNNPVDSGYVNVLVDGLDYRALVTNGSFTLPINRCYISDAPVQVLAIDLTTAQASAVATLAADTGIVNAGNFSACSVVPPANQFINFTLGGTAYALAAPADNITENTQYGYTRITGSNPTTNMQMIAGGISGAGTYSGGIDSAYLSIGNTYYYGPMTYNINSYGPIGSFTQGSFTATMTNGADGTTQQMTGSLDVIRAN